MIPRFAALLAAALLLGPTLRADAALRVDPTQSHIDVVVAATVDSFTGHLNAYDPQIILGPGGEVKSARFSFHFRDLVTGKEKRDRAMHRWQQTDSHPDGLFVLTSVASAPDGARTAFGRLTLHGTTRDIQFPIAISRDQACYAIDGDATIDTREFGLPVIRMMGVLKVDPRIHVRFHLQGECVEQQRAS